MEEAEYSPLTQACIKALIDRMPEKRKFAASEIEKMTAEFSAQNNFTMINRLIIVLGKKFCLSSTPNTRKGGLLGIAAVMVGFQNGSDSEPPPETVEEVVRPVLTCLLDSDSQVRYYACESLYNVTKVAKSSILPMFASIFDSMSKIVADPDIGVRSGAEVLDRLLKDIVVEQQASDFQNFVPKLEEYIYTKNLFTRMFIISWIRLLDSRIDMIAYLPRLLDGIFNCLCDSTEEIRASTLSLLSEFLNKIVVCPTDKLEIPSLTSTILKHARNDKEDVVQYTAIAWLRQFISLMNDQDLINFSPGILAAILPSLAVQSTPEGSVVSNRDKYPTSVQRYIPQSPSRGNICEISSLVNSLLLDQVAIVLDDRRKTLSSETTSSDLEPILEVLTKELQRHEHPVIKLAILEWFKKLRKAEPELVFTANLQQKLIEILLETLSARSDIVVKNSLRVIADTFCFDCEEEQQVVADNVASQDERLSSPQLPKDDGGADLEKKRTPTKTQPILQRGQLSGGSSTSSSKKVAIAIGGDQLTATRQSNANISRFIQALCKTFRDKDLVFEERGTFIVVNLCSMVRPDIIYKSFAEIINDDKTDLRFAYNLVQKLNQILLTTQPLYGLRTRLANDDDPEMTALFNSLYYAWCHSPTAVLSLCLLTNNHRHASEIVVALSQTDINLDLLTQIDWLVQLIESPVFAALRMKLLDTSSNQYLLQSLYGLLMILPQSEAYRRLGNRLDQVYKFLSVQQNSTKAASIAQPSSSNKLTSTGGKEPKRVPSTISLDSLMKHYFSIQNQRSKLSRSSENDD